MKIIFAILLVFVSSCQAETRQLPRGEFVELSTEPFDVPPVNETQIRNGKIYAGLYAATGQFPYFSLIFIRRATKTVQCGAALISASWVISAKHCVNDALAIELRFGLTHRDYYEQKGAAAALAKFDDNDISLIFLKSPVYFSTRTQPVLLPRQSELSDPFLNKAVTTCGMGLENESKSIVSTYLKYAELTTVKCTPYGAVDSNYICAQSMTSLASSCAGDSGSPIVSIDPKTKVHTLRGTVSFGNGAGCEKGHASGYGRVTKIISAIYYYTGIAARI